MYFEDYYSGQRFKTGTHLVTSEEIVEFASQYDPRQVINLDRMKEAKEARESNLVAASEFLVLSIGWGLWIRANIFGEANQGGIAMDEMRFEQQVVAGDILTVEASVLELRPMRSRPQLGIIILAFHVKNQLGQSVLNCKDISLVARKSEMKG